MSICLFHGVPISKSTAIPDEEINKAQFYQALADSISARVLPESERPIVEWVNVLFPNSWPNSVATEHGENELKLTCEKFLVPHNSNLKHEYRDFQDTKGAEVADNNLKRPIGAIHILPASTAECERGFSRMNIICSPL